MSWSAVPGKVILWHPILRDQDDLEEMLRVIRWLAGYREA